ncbi:MAG: hypothetical protein ACFHX7_00695 [Pseudomonadota bacterium]
MRTFRLVLVLCSLVYSAAGTADSPGDVAGVVKVLDLAFGGISEMSGMVRSRRFDDIYWMHNDSGDTARLFAVNSEGRVQFPGYLADQYHGETMTPGTSPWPGLTVLGASNVDWEDIAIDEDNLYIADLGNNGNARRDLGVYVLPEPNPRQIAQARALKFVPVRYPSQASYPAEQWHYDSEAMFIYRGKLYFLTKHRQPGKISEWEAGTRLYRLDSMATDRVNVLRQVDMHDEVAVVTAADLSPDGRRLAVLCYTALWIFEAPRSRDRWLSGKARMTPLDLRVTGQAEAVAWRDDRTLLIGNEGSELFLVTADEVPYRN